MERFEMSMYRVAWVLLLAAAGCSDPGKVIEIDGSSTVFPILQIAAEEFRAEHGGQITIGVSGTGGGFKKFCRGEISITGASRPVRASERAQCKEAGIDFIELPVAYDGVVIVVNPKNDWVDHMTVDELKTIWAPASQGEITRWSQVRDGWPDQALHLFGAGVDSGTYDYFTEAVVGEEHASRGDFTSSENDNVLVQGISTDSKALGFFGYAYYEESKDVLKAVPVDDGDPENGAGPVAASPATIADGTYQPLSRPLFVYVSVDDAERPAVEDFIEYLLGPGRPLVREVGYVPLPDRAYELVAERFARRTTGTLFAEGAKVGVTVEELLSE